MARTSLSTYPGEPRVQGATGRPQHMARQHEWKKEFNAATGGSPHNWIAGAIKKPGSLRAALHVPAGQKIPAKKLTKAAHSSNPTLRKRANLAKTLASFHR
jgi:hypothetical protein